MARFFVRPTVVTAAVFTLAQTACNIQDESSPATSRQELSREITYYEHIAPLLNEHCVNCHSDGGIAPFALADADGVLALAPLINDTMKERVMPPWLVDESDDCQTFRDSLWMDQADIDLVSTWVDNGSPLGKPSEALPPPPKADSLEGDDVIVLDPGVEYTPFIQYEQDNLQCFVVDPGIDHDMIMTAFEVLPGQPSMVHHLILYRVNTATALQQVEALAQAYDGPGYPCFGGPFDSGDVDEAELQNGSYDILGVWQPGQAPSDFPGNSGLRIGSEQKLVMRIHYYIPNGPLPDRTTMRLRLSDSVDNEAVIVFLADYDMELQPGLAEASTSVEYSVRDLWGENDVELLGLMPHEHDIGRTIRVRLTGGEDEDEVCLSWTPNWDFDWQQFYFYTSSVRARPDQTIRIDCTYDTRTRGGITIYGEGAQDEMCVAVIVGVPVQ